MFIFCSWSHGVKIKCLSWSKSWWGCEMVYVVNFLWKLNVPFHKKMSIRPLVPHSILLMSFMLYFNISPKLSIHWSSQTGFIQWWFSKNVWILSIGVWIFSLFTQDSKKENVTSGYCKWVKRAKGNEDPILFTELETSYVRETGTSTPRPTEDKYTPIIFCVLKLKIRMDMQCNICM
jgi:hypothetical protein